MGSFFKTLFDLKFETFITRKIAGIFYAIALGVIALFAVIALLGGLFQAVSAIGSGYSSGVSTGLGMLLVIIVVVPLMTFVSVILTRLVFESSVALVTVAENTKK
jgi:hypothetical protein